MSHPRVVLGLPAFNRPDTLPRALESLLSQRFADFALTIVDDSPSPEVRAIAERYGRLDARITYEANPGRLGMVRNWRRAFARARERHPEAEYFAWVSDHDIWSARWLAELVAVLDRDADVVLAYCESLQMTERGSRRDAKRFETRGMRSRRTRIRESARRMLAGGMVYGLMRAAALEAAGIFRPVLVPDRQVMLALSLFGQVRQVPEILWYREFGTTFSLQRQREAFCPDGAPLYMYLPWQLQHAGVLAWDFVVRGRGRPEFGRLAGAGYTALQLWESVRRDLERPRAWRRRAA